MIASSAAGSRAAADVGEAGPEAPEVSRATQCAAVVQAGAVPQAIRRGRGAPPGRATVAVDGWGAPPCLRVGAAAGRGSRSRGSRCIRRAEALLRPAGARTRAPPSGHFRWVVVGRAAFRAALLPSACDVQDLVGALPRRRADSRDVLPGSSSGAVSGRGGRGRGTRRFYRAGAFLRLADVCRSAPPGSAITCGRWTSAMLLLRKCEGRGGQFRRDCLRSNLCMRLCAPVPFPTGR